MTLAKKEGRSAILWARIAPSNASWVRTRMKKLGYRSRSEFMDDLITELRGDSRARRKT